MKGKYKGIWSVDELIQGLAQDRELFFRRFGITHVRNPVVFFTAVDARGEEVTVFHPHTGDKVDGYINAAPYSCAADFYDNTALEPQPTIVPFSPV